MTSRIELDESRLEMKRERSPTIFQKMPRRSLQLKGICYCPETSPECMERMSQGVCEECTWIISIYYPEGVQMEFTIGDVNVAFSKRVVLK